MLLLFFSYNYLGAKRLWRRVQNLGVVLVDPGIQKFSRDAFWSFEQFSGAPRQQEGSKVPYFVCLACKVV